jgi:hypothetical protein
MCFAGARAKVTGRKGILLGAGRTCPLHKTKNLVAGNALVNEVVGELALNGARHASILAAFVCHDLLQPHLLPVRGHCGSAVRQQGLALALHVTATLRAQKPPQPEFTRKGRQKHDSTCPQ